ncbi:hypothetical protein K3727_09940 [Rhodobacteraceae bacterium M382]|nr:hypothetical protein K3727_09940 [Rhodobacteraceae bacterium M382]
MTMEIGHVMAKTLKNLALALLNATLILVALCLFLAWKTAVVLDGATATFAQNLIKVEPLRDEVRGARNDLAELRQDLVAIKDKSNALSTPALQRLQHRVQLLDSRIEGVQSQVRTLAQSPEVLITHTVETAADALTRSVLDIKGCVPAG